MGAFIVYVLLGFLVTELIYKDKQDKPTALPVVTGFLCGFAYDLFHRAVMINGTQEQAIAAGLIYSGGLFILIFAVSYYINKAKKKESAIEFEEQDAPVAKGHRSHYTTTSINCRKAFGKIHPLLKNWMIPAVILVLLAGAWSARWDETASKSEGQGVVKWETDRWTGDRWMTVYSYNGVYELPLKGSEYRKVFATNMGRIITGLDFAWLGYALWAYRREGLPRAHIEGKVSSDD